ncbi:unnamed protein product [Agarophyton chilense]
MSNPSGILDTAVRVDTSVAAKMNDNLEKINRFMSLMDQRTEESTKAAREGTRILEQLAEKVIQQDQKRHNIYMTAMSDRKENLEKEQAMCKFADDALEARKGQFRQLYMQKSELNEAVEELREKLNSLPYERKRYEGKLNEEDRRLRSGRHVAEERLKQVNEVLRRNEETMRKFEAFLGVKVRAVDDKCLEFTFTHIKSSDQHRKYKVTVLSHERRFSATKCDPEIENFGELKEQLSKDGQLIDFLHKVRQSFKLHELAADFA